MVCKGWVGKVEPMTDQQSVPRDEIDPMSEHTHMPNQIMLPLVP